MPQAKLKKKGANVIVANDVSADTGIGGATGVMGGDRNRVTILSAKDKQIWPEMSKTEVATKLADLVSEQLQSAP